jgi:CubicO group peptidase (beta-lactamase class C family)
MNDLERSVDRIATETRFSGVVRIDRGDEIELVKAYGFAHRGWGIANTVDTRFAIASGTKGVTALTVMSLVEEGRLDLGTTARSMLRTDLPLIDDAVTVEHLLAHRSGIGDYYDEEIEREPTDYVMPISVHELSTSERYLRVLDGFPSKFPPGERFSYSNGGYVVLGLIAERCAGTPFHELVRQRVCEPAGMADTAFLRSDELPGRVALGYLGVEGNRTNVFHLPVRGSGDGGILAVPADRPARPPLLRARAIALHHRDRDAGVPLCLLERLHRDGLEPHAVDASQWRTLGARVVRDRDGRTRQHREGDDAPDQRGRESRSEEEAAAGLR